MEGIQPTIRFEADPFFFFLQFYDRQSTGHKIGRGFFISHLYDCAGMISTALLRVYHILLQRGLFGSLWSRGFRRFFTEEMNVSIDMLFRSLD